MPETSVLTINTAEALDRTLDKPVDVLLGAHVAVDADGLGANLLELVRHFVELVVALGHVADRYRKAVAAETQGDSAPYALARAGDDGDLAWRRHCGCWWRG